MRTIHRLVVAVVVVALWVTGLAGTATAVAPANDDFANAIDASGTSFSTTIDNTEATVEEGEPRYGNCSDRIDGTVWYSFTAASDTLVTLDVAGAPAYTAIVVVYTGSFGSLNEVACLVGTSSWTSGTFLAAGGTTYRIQVGTSEWGSRLASLPLTLTTEVPTAPANDDLADATVLTAGPLNEVVDARVATAETGEPPDVGYCAGARHSIWYRLEPTQDLLVTVDTLGSVSDSGGGRAQLGVYSGPSDASFEDLSLLICGTDYFGPGENESKAWFLARPGTAYFIQAYGGAWAADLGLSHLHVNIATEVAPLPPANDDFEGATDVDAPTSVVVDSRNAALQDGEPQLNSCTGVGSSVWYRITPAEDLIVQADTFGTASEADNLYPSSTIAAYRGDSLGSLDEVTSSCDLGNSYGEGRVRFVAKAGQTYYLQVGRDKRLGSPTFGLAKLHVNVVFESVGPPPANDDFEDATLVSTPGSFTDTIDDARNASVQTGEPRWNDCHGLLFTVWYVLQPTEDLTVFADTHGTRALQDSWVPTNLTVLRGTSLGGLTEIASSCEEGNDDAESAVRFVARAGETYYLQVGRLAGTPPEPGTGLRGLVVHIDTPERPANDDLAGAEVVQMGATSRIVDTRAATVQDGEPTEGCEGAWGTIWYAFTPQERSVLRADTFGSWEDSGKRTQIAVYSGPDDPTTFEALSFEGCSAGAGPSGTEARVRIVVEPGATYYVQVGESWGDRGLRSLHVNIDARPAPLPPANDERAGAIAIGALPYAGSVDPTSATVGASDPDACGLGASTVWWSLAPQKTQRIQAHTWDSDGFAYLSVWESTPEGLQPVVCNWGSTASFDAVGGHTYFFMVSAASGSERAALYVQAAPTITVKVKEARLDENGVVQISGSARCTAEMWVYVDGTIRQRTNRRNATGTFWAWANETCVPGTVTHWTGEVYYSDTGVPFNTGTATVEAHGYGQDPLFGDWIETWTTATVKLVR